MKTILILIATLLLTACGGADNGNADTDGNHSGIGQGNGGAGGEGGAGGAGGIGGAGGSIEPECTLDEQCGDCGFCTDGACRIGCSDTDDCRWNDSELEMMCCHDGVNPVTGTGYTSCRPAR